MVRITTWNVNGIRNPFSFQPWRKNPTFAAMFDILEADIVIMQELKIQRKDLKDEMVLVPGWDCYFSLPKHKKGYSGVGIYTRNSACAPIRAEEGLLGVLCPPGMSTPYRDLPADACIGGYPTPAQLASLEVDATSLDAEGRCLVLEFPAFVLFGVYSPANSNGLRDNFRYGFLTALDTRIRNLAKMGKRVVLTGDLNVSREEIDTAKADEHMRQEGITREDYLNAPNRRVFNQLLENGKVPGNRDEGREQPILSDLCREFHPEREGMFTHWEQKINARPANFGSRIDYVLCSIEMKSWFAEANIQEGLMGSDHCPVYAATKPVVDCEGTLTHIVDMMNPVGMFRNGERIRDFSPATDILPLSGRLLPDFDKRRTIKDMFKSSVRHTTTTETPAASSPISTKSPEKRSNSGSPIPKPSKKTKLNSAPSNSAISSSKGQKSLRGFLAPKDTATSSRSATTSSQPLPDSHSQDPSSTTPSNPDTSSFSSASASASDPYADAQSAKESWVKLFSKKPPPRCEGHNEPCKSFVAKKQNANVGRHFWTCPRPIGPSGQKENGTQWQCGTFIWAKDWNAPGTQG